MTTGHTRRDPPRVPVTLPVTVPVPVPVTVVTGFLGSGKTTLLNHILTREHGLKVGLIVNEFGAISIDDKLIARRTERMIELANGCICCATNGDLMRSLADILDGGGAVEYILIETSGVADPLPVAALLTDASLEGVLRLDGIVTLVDAANFDANLERAEVAYNQLVHGDILLINKIDLVADEIPALIERGIRTINPNARLVTCVNADVDPHILLDVGVSRLRERFAAADGAPAHHHDHAAHAAFQAHAYTQTRPFDAPAFQAFAEALSDRVFRAKGILYVAGASCRYIFHLVGERATVLPGAPWAAAETRATELVFIGRDFDVAALEDALAQCLAQPM